MELVKQHWTKKDIDEFYNFEQTLIGTEKECVWEQKIVNTKLKCYGKTSSKAKEVAKQIKKGNFCEFVDNLRVKTHFDSLIKAFLICQIKDFEVFEEKLTTFVETIDNWASCDTLKFQKCDKDKLFELSKKYLISEKPFVRRVGLNIFFELVKYPEFDKKCFAVLDSLKNEKEYYVNMCASWLLCEYFVKRRDKTLEYFKNSKTNSFIINKAISKCRDSFRVSPADKNLLLKYKK